MLRIVTRALALGLALQGAFMIWLAGWGALWGYESGLGWFAPHILRPGLVVIGAASIVYGLWAGWISYAVAGRVLTTWVDDLRADLRAGAVGDLGWREVVRLYAREAWCRRGCLIGQHGLENLNYFPGEGTICENCGLRVALRLSLSDRFWLAVNRPTRVEDKWSSTLERVCPPPPEPVTYEPIRPEDITWGERAVMPRGSVSVLHPDGQRRLEDVPEVAMDDDTCRACNRPICEHEPGEYDDECPYFVPQTLNDPLRHIAPDKES